MGKEGVIPKDRKQVPISAENHKAVKILASEREITFYEALDLVIVAGLRVERG